MDKFFIVLVASIFFLVSFIACEKYPQSEAGLKEFIAAYEQKLEPLSTAHNLAQWNAYITGKKEYFDKATTLSLRIDSMHQSSEDFRFIKKLREDGKINDPALKRQLDILYTHYLSGQINPELNRQIKEIASGVEGVFANFRTEVDGNILSDNDVTKILKTEKNSAYREKVWRAQKAIGLEVADDIVQLAKLRNEAARQLGYPTYFEMAMDMSELDPDEVTAVFEELDRLTEEPFREVHDEIEQVFSERYRTARQMLRPWHYEDLFAQEAPAIYAINLDDFYKDVDIIGTATTFYNSFNMSVEDILERSDLYEKEGKSQHAFSFWIDRKDDIRILCNIVPNERWMSTTLHELGHALYDKYIDRDLPFLLRNPAHPFTTEGIAMLMDRMATNAHWMAEALDISKSEQKKVATVTTKSSRLSKLIFARWSMVVFNFEKALYNNPDQDLNELWWNLVNRYQLIRKPENPVGGEWATKMHIAMYPVYYQNYQLGELFASQLLSHINEQFYGNASFQQTIFWDNAEAGDYLKEAVFTPGKSFEWNDMIEKATGEKLNPAHFVKLYVES